MTDEQLAVARKDSANLVLQIILDKRPASPTVKLYKIYIGLWQKFWDDMCKNSDGTVNESLVDYTVDAARMLEFFQAVVFKRTVRKFVSPDAGYQGQVGLESPMAMGQMGQAQPESEGLWEPSTAPASSSKTDWEVTQALDFTAQITQPGPVQQDEEIDDEIDAQPEDHVRPGDDDESEDEDD
ncbi:hypothetical protein BGX27_005057, partial [Mortierella sp. AM989]